MDQDDPTNIAVGMAALVRNCKFEQTSVRCRDGIQTAITGLNQAPITGLMGLVYNPETAPETSFQLPLLFDMMGSLMGENPVGTGHAYAITGPLVSLPENSHMIGRQAYNRGYLAFSNLITPTAPMAVYSLNSKNLDPYGLKIFGGTWQAQTSYGVGEVVTPTVSNGHTYRCTVAGISAVTEPAWPTTENGTVVDGAVTWEELTAVLANRIPAPGAPLLTLASGGSIASGLDVYIVLALNNNQGVTVPSVASKVTTVAGSSAVNVTIPSLASMAGWIRGLPSQYIPNLATVYVASVATGDPDPPISAYEQFGAAQALGTTYSVTAVTGSVQPAASNTARITPGQLPAPVISPILSRVTAGGTFPAGRDVYVFETYVNDIGETTPGPTNMIPDTAANDAFTATGQGLEGFQMTGINIYEADVPTGANPPDPTEFALVGNVQPGASITFTTSAAGNPPPISNTSGPGGNIAPDVSGLRYAVIAYVNRNKTISGIISAIVSYFVDEGGWELSIFNVATGPSNVIQRIVAFTVADGTNVGAFFYIPTTTLSFGVSQTATVINDNTSSSATFNFTDTFLVGSTDITYRLQTINPPPAVDMYYSPSVDRFILTGVPGFGSGHYITRAADAESIQGDTGLVLVGSSDGQRTICAREWQGTIYSLRERSGFVITPSTSEPSSWNVEERWNKVGPCGPRAVDVCPEFMIFVHRSGIYLFSGSLPELVSRENPRFWDTVNWQAQETIWVQIDVETLEVRVGLPVAGSTVPNVIATINYRDGWGYPLHFSTISGKMSSMPQTRKYSFDDLAAFCALRIERAVPNQPIPVEGEVGVSEQDAKETITQFLLASSSPDGTVQAITPGVYNDNGAGIDQQYETVCPVQMMTVLKIIGVNINARGNGLLFASFLAMRTMVTDRLAGTTSKELKLQPITLTPDEAIGISRMCPSKINERWRLRLTNGKVKDAWFDMKYATIFTSPVATAREESEK